MPPRSSCSPAATGNKELATILTMTPARTETSPFGPALPGRPRRPTRDYTVVGLAGLLIVLAAASLFIGVQDLSPRDLFSLSDEQALVLFVSRLPRLISLVIAGASRAFVA